MTNNLILTFITTSFLILSGDVKNKTHPKYNIEVSKSLTISKAKKLISTPFEGEWNWEKNNDTKSFSLTIKQDTSNNLIGTYCYILKNGDKVDCPDGNQISFKLAIPSGNSFSTVFASSYSQQLGNVTITFDGTNLIWQVTQVPGGEYYCPLNAKLIKE